MKFTIFPQGAKWLSESGFSRTYHVLPVELMAAHVRTTWSLKTEPDRSLLASVRDDRFKQLRICVWV